jgi:hypothetical protein
MSRTVRSLATDLVRDLTDPPPVFEAAKRVENAERTSDLADLTAPIHREISMKAPLRPGHIRGGKASRRLPESLSRRFQAMVSDKALRSPGWLDRQGLPTGLLPSGA